VARSRSAAAGAVRAARAVAAAVVALAPLAALPGCGGPREGGPAAAAREAAIVAVGHPNALILAVAVRARGDSARIVYWGGPDSTAATPWRPLAGDTTRIAVLGLLPSTTYRVTAEVRAGGRTVRSDTVASRTFALPPYLETVRLTWSAGAPSSPYLLASGDTADFLAYTVAFDRQGRIRWYRAFPVPHGSRAVLLRQLPNGHFLTEVGESSGWQKGYDEWVEFLPTGERVRSFAVPRPWHSDEHDALFEFADTVLRAVTLLGYTLDTVDLSPIGGVAKSLVGSHTIFRMDPDGRVVWRWATEPHYGLADWIEPPGVWKQWDNVDFDHPNALELDRDGNYLVSFRNFGAVVKIDYHTGRILWQIGGRRSTIRLVGDSLGLFSGQHFVRLTDEGNLLLYDNGLRHKPPLSRAVEYAVDPVARTATLVWEFRHRPRIFTPLVGSAVRLRNGNTLIDWGWSSKITEVTRSGEVVAEGLLTIGGQWVHPYQMHPAVSLYRWERP
jgi:hypothetical protein